MAATRARVFDFADLREIGGALMEFVRRRLSLFRGAGILFAVVLFGCDRSGPRVEFVEGIIRLDGDPVAGATVNFRPLEAGGQPAYGSTNTAGVYRLTTPRGGRPDGGAVAGDYSITITKWRYNLPPEPDPNDALARADWMRKKEALERLPPDYIVPKRYGDPKTSGLTASVKQGRNTGEAFVFELTSDPPK